MLKISMGEEKRECRRLAVSVPVNYELLDSPNKEYGNTVSKDISEGGIRLVFNRFYPPATKFLIKIDLEHVNKIIDGIAEIIWASNLRFSNTYFSGLRFIDISNQNQEIIKELITIKGEIS